MVLSVLIEQKSLDLYLAYPLLECPLDLLGISMGIMFHSFHSISVINNSWFFNMNLFPLMWCVLCDHYSITLIPNKHVNLNCFLKSPFLSDSNPKTINLRKCFLSTRLKILSKCYSLDIFILSNIQFIKAFVSN